jgi:hypothetical protein
VGGGDVGAAEGLDLGVASDVPQNARLVAGARQNGRLVQEASTREVPARETRIGVRGVALSLFFETLKNAGRVARGCQDGRFRAQDR